jgi:F-type H+-transporting ATPase subunit b
MRSWLMIGFVLSGLAIAVPAPLLAADKEAEEHPKADGHDKAGGHGVDHHAMDQFSKAWVHLSEEEKKRILDELTRNMTGKDRRAAVAFFDSLAADYAEKHKTLGVEHGIFKGAIEVSLWTILVFLLLLFVLGRFAWGPILEGLNKREQTIARDKHDAELARKEAGELRTKLDAERAQAADEIRQIFDKARQDAQKTASEELARGKSELQAERQRMFNDVRVASDDALKEIWTKVAAVATLISGKAIKKKLTEEDHRALVDEALNEFRAAAAARKGEVEEARA